MKYIDVYFSPRQVSNPASASPSPRKPELAVADWLRHNLPIRIVDLVPAGREQHSVAREISVPVAWNMAGHYQTPLARVLEIHRNTVAACVAEYVVNEPG